ncbi:hypothetical protein FRUB_01879 [Fimbriiglobus ruber]|uniref:Uncharacterized protein n=1 Tax=Fimbriiglobus ruber TaxID=1908690 RepID=A0A225E424_9BACT|nr:hypothetical protein FRUB_01879 [Fimbriiglobus ruber]
MLHFAEKTEIGKHAIHTAGAAAVGAVVAAAPVLVPVAIAAGPIALVGVAAYGLWKWLDS